MRVHAFDARVTNKHHSLTLPRTLFIPWLQEDGKASCSADSRWEGKCENTISKSPNKDDDTGVMLTKPASLDIVDTIIDEVLGIEFPSCLLLGQVLM